MAPDNPAGPFNALQNYGSSKAPLLYYIFDALVLSGDDVRGLPLEKRREFLEKKVLPKLAHQAASGPGCFCLKEFGAAGR